MTPAGRALGLILGELHDHDNLIRRITIAVVPTGGIAVAVAVAVAVPIETTKILGFSLLI
jgi:predicted phosphoribosyltransferase